MQSVLERIALLAKRTSTGAYEVSVTLLRGGGASAAAFTGALALDLDEIQYEYASGPCLEAAERASTVQVTDMMTETRWPAFVQAARSAGVRSSLSTCIPVQQDVTGALNIYASAPDAFDSDAVAIAQNFAAYAGVALSNANVYARTAALAEQMQAAMRSRGVIEQAKGVVMGQRRCGAEEAFQVLAGMSQDSNRKLRDVAQEVVDAAIRPEALS